MDTFTQRKISILSKEDKSSKKSWDKKIINLCKKINSKENYYTTSSCSGKSIIMKEKIGKDGTYYFWTSHDLINFKELKQIINSASNLQLPASGSIKFKSESPIIYVVCKDINSAKNIFEKSVKSGFKESGIKLTDKLIAVEIRSGEKIEFPLILRKKVLVSDEFLKEVIKISNKKRKSGWEKIKKLSSLIE